MFRPIGDQDLATNVADSESNYLIQKNDLLSLQVYTNLGESIVDPAAGSVSSGNQQGEPEAPSYLVDQNGVVKFPLINDFKAEGMTLRQAEKALEDQYGKFYQQPFVKLKYSNKRVIILGAVGSQVVRLENENMKLTEVLALAKGFETEAKANNIRVLRGNQVFIADFSTIEGYKKYNYTMQPNDVIYVEPIRRPFVEGLRDYGPAVSIISSLATLIVVLIGVN
jgi:polysaccharide biosynthesis/export protein